MKRILFSDRAKRAIFLHELAECLFWTMVLTLIFITWF